MVGDGGYMMRDDMARVDEMREMESNVICQERDVTSEQDRGMLRHAVSVGEKRTGTKGEEDSFIKVCKC